MLTILIALIAIAVFLGYFFYVGHIGVSDEFAVKWSSASLTAALVFGLTLKKVWPYRRKWELWVSLGALVTAHFILVQHLHWEKPNYFLMPIVIGLPEMFIAAILLNVVLNTGPDFWSRDNS